MSRHPTPASPRCGVCTRPVTDSAHVCRDCARDLLVALHRAAQLAAQLEVTFSRQAVGRRREGARSAETPLPYSPPAGDALHALRNTLSGWVRVLIEEGAATTWPRDDVVSMCRWLANPARVAWLRQHPAGPEAVLAITSAAARGWDIVDSPLERKDLGPCLADTAEGPCPFPLNALPDELHVECRRCRTVHDVQARRERILADAEDQLMIATWLAFAVTGLGRPVKRSTIASWVHRGRLLSHGRDETGRELYRVGDVLDLLATAARAVTGRKKASA